MIDAPSRNLTPRDLIHVFHERRRLWLVPTIVGTVLGVVFAAAMPHKWEATQGLIVRQEASGSQQDRPGSFATGDEMKRTQETILEIAKSPSVLAGTLREVGPPPSWSGTLPFPTQEAIEDFRGSIHMKPPGGAEFGMTEVVYVAVRAGDRSRALRLLKELCTHIEVRYMEVRDERAQSMIEELERSVALAEVDLEDATVELAEFESSIGADLTELRMLLDSPSGMSDLRQKLISVENARQEFMAQLQQQQKLLEMLKAAQENPLTLLATPNSLLDAQPALRRLKEGLIEAQLTTSRLLGRRSPSHPEVIGAQHAEREVRERLRSEVATAIRGVEVDLQISEGRIAAVEKEIARGRRQLEALASRRARYANLVALTEDRTRLLEQARSYLAEVQASQASARAASLIGRIDAPYVGVNPVGPGKTVIAAAGMASGLAAGIALVFLFGIPTPSPLPMDHGLNTALVWQTTQFAQLPSLPGYVSPPTAPFGMFRGKTLRQAIEEVRRRDQSEGTCL